MDYEILSITIRPGTAGEAYRRIGGALGEAQRLLGFWSSDIGRLNRLISLWSCNGELGGTSYATSAPWLRDIEDLSLSVTARRYRMFPFLQPVRPGTYGPFYEFRDYRLKIDALAPTLDSWARVIGERIKVSPIVGAMYEIGAPQNYVQFWPYRSLDERHALRAQVVTAGSWPPPGVVSLIQEQETSILLPAPFSPLQ